MKRIIQFIANVRGWLWLWISLAIGVPTAIEQFNADFANKPVPIPSDLATRFNIQWSIAAVCFLIAVVKGVIKLSRLANPHLPAEAKSESHP